MNLQSGRFRWLEACVTLLLLVTAGFEFLLYSPPIHHLEYSLSVNAEIVGSSSNPTFRLQVTHGAADRFLRLVAYSLSGVPEHQRSVFVYYDGGYPTASANPTAAQGVFDHLQAELLIRQYSQPVVAVGAAGLADILRATDTAGSRVVVAMTGVLPSNVFSAATDLLTPWVRAGGIVAWGGATIGFYSGVRGQPLSQAPSGASLGESGSNQLLGSGTASLPWAQMRTANAPSDLGAALGIRYRLASAGIRRDVAVARGGRPLGWFAGAYSSLTYLPSGHGGYILFGGEITDDEEVGRDLAQILLTDVIDEVGSVAVKEIYLPDLAVRATVDWEIPLTATGTRIMLIAFDPNPDGVFFFARSITPLG